nr:hypothetical protein [Tanacetum cinerariifolium]
QSANEDVDWIYFNEDDEKKDDVDDDKSIDLEMTDDEEIKDEFVRGAEHVNDDKDEEMTEAEVAEPEKGDEEIADTAKTDTKKTEEVMDDAKKAKLPPTSSSLSISLVLIPILETPLVAPATTLLPSPFVSTIPHVLQQQATPILTPPITTESPTIIATVPESDALTIHIADLIQKYSVKLASEPIKTQTPTIYLEQEYEKSPSEIHKIKKQKLPKYTMQSTNKAALKEYDQKIALYQTMNENKPFNRNPANHALYHALMDALIKDENAMDKGVADTLKNHKRHHNDDDDNDDDDNEDPSAGPNQGKKTKRRRTKDSESSKKPSTTKETSKGKAPSKSSKTHVVLDDVQPKDALEPKTDKTPNHNWFKQPLRPPTPNPEWNKYQVVLDQVEQP